MSSPIVFSVHGVLLGYVVSLVYQQSNFIQCTRVHARCTFRLYYLCSDLFV